MTDIKQQKRVVTAGPSGTSVDVFRCTYCGHTVTGSSPNYTEEFSTPNTGGVFACRARGGSLPHVTH